jgi:P27 family predicted phage terminase small subunit
VTQLDGVEPREILRRMGKPGPKPREIKDRKGTTRKVREPKKRHAIGATTCPKWLGTEAKQEWKRLGPELAEAGILRKDTRMLVAAYCAAAGTLRLAMAQQQAAGDDLQKLSKAFTLADKAMKQMASHGYRLGIGDLFQREADAEHEKALALRR